MALTAQERARLTGEWRNLARQARLFAAEPGADRAEFRKLAEVATKWASPLDDYADAFLLFAFARLTTSLARSKLEAIAPRARALAHLAEVVADLLGPDPEIDAPARAYWQDH